MSLSSYCKKLECQKTKQNKTGAYAKVIFVSIFFFKKQQCDVIFKPTWVRQTAHRLTFRKHLNMPVQVKSAWKQPLYSTCKWSARFTGDWTLLSLSEKNAAFTHSWQAASKSSFVSVCSRKSSEFNHLLLVRWEKQERVYLLQPLFFTLECTSYSGCTKVVKLLLFFSL